MEGNKKASEEQKLKEFAKFEYLKKADEQLAKYGFFVFESNIDKDIHTWVLLRIGHIPGVGFFFHEGQKIALKPGCPSAVKAVHEYLVKGRHVEGGNNDN